MANTVNNQPLAASLQLTDYLLAWQAAQSPQTRKLPVSGLAGYYAQLTGSTFTGPITGTSANFPTGLTGGSLVSGSTLNVSTNAQVGGSLTVNGSATITAGINAGSLTSGSTLNVATTASIGGNLTCGGAASFPGGVTAGSLSSGSNLTVSGNTNLTGALVTGPASVTTLTASGATSVLSLQTTGFFAAAVTGWAYTLSQPPGASSGTFNFGISAGSSSVAANFFFAVSDRRTKQNIVTIDPLDGADFVMKSRPVTYEKNGSAGAGFISQEQIKAGYGQYVATVPHEGLPETTDDDGLVSREGLALHLDYSNYIAYVTAALQSAFARIEDVTAALQKALARIEALEDEVL